MAKRKVRLEPEGLDRDLLTPPLLRRVDKNGRISLSSDLKNSDVLVFVTTLQPGDKERFSIIGRLRLGDWKKEESINDSSNDEA